MPSQLEDAFAAVQLLAKDFDANKAHFLSPNYQESEVRKDFIDKFLIALGWDVNHDRQKNPFEQEVKVERGVTVHGAQRRADYAFYLAPNFRDVRFFAEAKKPFGDIATAQNYFQTIRYGWNAKTPIALLTDFEQFQILDCRHKPAVDTALCHCIRKFHFSEYADQEKFACIYYLFSREAVGNGSLEKFAGTLRKPRAGKLGKGAVKPAYQSIDDAFLEELDDYRDKLAHVFKNKNAQLDGETLTELTQRTIDRLVFMRFLEDKLIHPDSLIETFGRKGSAWQDFIATSRRLDGIYNGIVFKQHEILDAPSFRVDDGAFASICANLEPANSPYDFNSIPIHILGSIYERFLGKVIFTTDKRARVEEKPEVRKAGGVYYTPEYIVNYIVENTVGRLIEGKTPAQVEPMRFADIACGSGSFLLGIYDRLLRHHGKWFNANPDKAKRAGCVLRDDGSWQLSLRQRRQILLNNIYGVDIDHQAVEVAQLSLYLKLLQEETTASARQHQLEFRETLLPSLNRNIVCGNSLVGPDFGTGELFAGQDERKLNPMDYGQRFPEITKRGGFDAIVGNPPYVRQETLSGLKAYLETHYQSFDGVADLYTYFMEKALSLLREGGLFSYIVSSSFLRATYGEPLRRHLMAAGTVLQLVDFGGLAVFSSAKDTYVCIPLIGKGPGNPPPRIQVCKVPSLKITDLAPYVADHSFTVPPGRFSPSAWSLKSDSETAVFEKIKRCGRPLGDFAGRKFVRGLLTGLNEAFVITPGRKKQILESSPKSAGMIKPFLGGEDIRRYHVEDHGKLMIVIPCGWTRAEIAKTGKGGVSERQAWDWLKQTHAGLANHLQAFEGPLRERQDQGEFFWELRPCDYYASLEAPKIIFPDICKGPRFYFDKSGLYLANTAYCLGSDSLYLLGLLNSRLFWFAISNLSIPFGIRAGEYRYRLIYQYMEQVPIRPIDLQNPAEKSKHNKMVSLVEQALAAAKQLAAAHSDKDKDFYGNKCASIDAQIDALVYELYGLTAGEIATLEGTFRA